MWKTRSTALVLALAALVAVVAAGCGAEEIDPRTAVAEASSNTTNAGSSRLEFSLAMTIAGQEIALTGNGEFDYAAQRGRLAYDMSSILEGIPGAPPGVFGDGMMELVYDENAFYIGFPEGSAIEQELGSGKRWMRIDLGTLGDAAGFDLGALMQLDQNPVDQLRLLQAASDEVEDLGREDVRGVETTHYRARVDFDRATDAALDQADLPEGEREALERQLRDLQEQAGADATISMDVWLDDEGRLRRSTMEMAMVAEGEELTTQMTMELYDFGVEVDVEPPPAREVIDLADTFSGDFD